MWVQINFSFVKWILEKKKRNPKKMKQTLDSGLRASMTNDGENIPCYKHVTVRKNIEMSNKDN